jgi:chemotaxis-related protein WspD
VTPSQAPSVVDCWNRIGVRGDRSCPELATAIHCHNCRVFTAAAQALLDRPAAREYLSELTEFVSEPVAKRRLADRSALLVRVGAEHFAISTEEVTEVADSAEPRRVPHRGNRVFAGLINVRGQLELCISLAALLGIPKRSSDEGALLVDAVLGVERFDESQMVDPPAAAARASTAYVRALVAHEGQHFAWLDLARLSRELNESVRGIARAGL